MKLTKMNRRSLKRLNMKIEISAYSRGGIATSENWDVSTVKSALRKDGNQLGLIKDPSEELIDIAIHETVYACRFADKMSREQIMYCINSPEENVTLSFTDSVIESMDSTLKEIAISKNPDFYKKIKNPTEEMSKLAIMGDCEMFKYVKEKTRALSLLAVSMNGLLLEYVDDQDPEIFEIAIRNNPYAIEFAKVASTKVLSDVFSKHPEMIRSCNIDTIKLLPSNIIGEALYENPILITSLPEEVQTVEICSMMMNSKWFTDVNIHKSFDWRPNVIEKIRADIIDEVMSTL